MQQMLACDGSELRFAEPMIPVVARVCGEQVDFDRAARRSSDSPYGRVRCCCRDSNDST